MKKFYAGLVISMLFFGVTLAGAYTITDTGDSAYWGGTVHNAGATIYGDVIGSPYFNVDSMDVTRSGKDWTVKITGNYFYYRQTDLDSGFPKALKPGDLYINSTGWNATGSGNYATDTFNSAEGWNYVITKVDNSWGLYSLDFTTIDNTNVNALSHGNYIYRENQAWRGGEDNYIGTASRSFEGTGLSSSQLVFKFNTGNLSFGDDVGFHWTMQCGNDVIEGLAHVPAPVPEPGTMMLLGSGLVGLAGWGRKKFRK